MFNVWWIIRFLFYSISSDLFCVVFANKGIQTWTGLSSLLLKAGVVLLLGKQGAVIDLLVHLIHFHQT